MPPKDFFSDYLDWERKQAEKREQLKRDAKRAADALVRNYGGSRRVS